MPREIAPHDIEVRACRLEDFEGVLSLLKQLWPNATLELERLRRAFADATRSSYQLYLCATVRGRIVGFGSLSLKESLWAVGPLAHCDELVVDGDHRGQGMGTRLLKSLEAAALERGARRIELDSAYHRATAHAWYRRRGYCDRGVVFSKPL
jgi:GNAT superfamily N-acetyltransferase